jgi:precorrin-3B methylase
LNYLRLLIAIKQIFWILNKTYRHVNSTALEDMLEYMTGMNSTVIIGSSTTFASGGWMVTPRGYETKCSLEGTGNDGQEKHLD